MLESQALNGEAGQLLDWALLPSPALPLLHLALSQQVSFWSQRRPRHEQHRIVVLRYKVEAIEQRIFLRSANDHAGDEVGDTHISDADFGLRSAESRTSLVQALFLVFRRFHSAFHTPLSAFA